MPNFTVTLNSSNQVTSLSAASREDYIQLVHDYANAGYAGEYLDQYDLDTLAEAILDASEPWLSFDECEDLFCSLGLA